MTKTPDRSHALSVLSFCGIFLPVLIFIHFSAGSMLFSKGKEFWVDETYGVNHSALGRSAVNLVCYGASGQASPAPMYYLLFKGCEPSFGFLKKMSIPQQVFWRWASLGPLIAGCLIFLGWKPPSMNKGCAVMIVALVLYSEMGLYYSAEARPYALWMAGSLLMLGGIPSFYQSWWWTVLGLCLGATATAVIFQFTAIAVALILGHLLLRKSIPLNGKLWAPLASGFGAALFYALRGQPLSYGGSEWGSWPVFFGFFLAYKWVIFGACFIVEQAYRDDRLERLCLYLAILGWFLMSPAVFAVTRYKHFFFTPRQYIYWTPAAAFVIVGLGQDLWCRLRSGKKAYASPAWWIAFIVFYLSTRPTHPHQTLTQINALIRQAISGGIHAAL